MTNFLRHSFGKVAELYARVRPGYPEDMFDDLVKLSELPAAGQVLEIGTATGQASVPMAQRGYRLTGVELSPELAAVGRERLAPYPYASIAVAAFESYNLPSDPFDLVMAATAWHWLDQDVAFRKAAAALRAGGSLAIIMNHHVAGGTSGFFAAVQHCYESFMPGTEPGIVLDQPDAIVPDTAGILASRLFDVPKVRRYLWTIAYTTDEYIDVLSTYSGHIQLEAENQALLFECIRGLIDSQFGGKIVKQYMTEMVVARKLS